MLINFLELFRSNLEASKFEKDTDNQVLKYNFDSPNLNRRVAKWIEMLGLFEIFPIPLKPGNIHIVADALSRIPNDEGVATKLKNRTLTIQKP